MGDGRSSARSSAAKGAGKKLRTVAPAEASVTTHRVRSAQRVRIIGGQWKRTLLPVSDAPGLRPTPDRVRETLFNWIGHLIPRIETVHGLDLFAGTGALGFELASRGAQRVTLIEANRRLVDQLTQTKRQLAAEQIEIVAGDALSLAARWMDASFDIIFIDPPFDSALLAPALAVATRLLSLDGLMYIESGVAIEPSTLTGELQVVRRGRAGRVHFHLLRRGSR